MVGANVPVTVWVCVPVGAAANATVVRTLIAAPAAMTPPARNRARRLRSDVDMATTLKRTNKTAQPPAGEQLADHAAKPLPRTEYRYLSNSARTPSNRI